jgi:diguanylate cyclase (GGDEF)-like protein
MGVHGGDFLAQTLQSQAQGAVQVTLDDPYNASPKPIAEVAHGTLMNSPGLVRSETLDVGHHTWHVVLRPTTRLLSTSDRWASQLTLLAGIAVTVLLGVLVAVLAGARNKAMDRVDQATAELRKDIERREAVEAQLQILAFSDQLTGLANRGLFYDRVGHALNTHGRAGHTFAVFFIDLDGFKQVNDELGHSAGDIVLKEVAARLRDCLRDGDTVARFGGDEFAVIAERLAIAENVHVTADRIVQAVREPIEVGGGVRATVTASVGIALNRPGDTADDVLHEADLAMYTAKTTGKGRHVLAGAAESKSEEQV